MSSSDVTTTSSAVANVTSRGRGGFRAVELDTIPEDVRSSELRSGKEAEGQRIEIVTNFIKQAPIKDSVIYQYRVDFEPNVESIKLRKRLFYSATRSLFTTRCIFDSMNDARSRCKLEEETTKVECSDERPVRRPLEDESAQEHGEADSANKDGDDKEADDKQAEADKRLITITIKNVGIVTGSFEMIRVYNMHMKGFMRQLGFYQVNSTGAYVHPSLNSPIGQTDLVALRGYKSSANIHEDNVILVSLESCHKLLQTKNVLQYMRSVRERGGDFAQNIKNALTNKLVVTSYNKIVYKIEDVNFQMNPTKTFLQRKTNTEITYKDYYQNRYQVKINDSNQPLLLAVQNNKRGRDTDADGQTQTDCYLVPELCNIAGLTDEQRADNRLKIELVRASQVSPSDRVKNLTEFLNIFHNSSEIKSTLDQWGYSYGRDPLTIPGRIMKTEVVGVGERCQAPPFQWPSVNGNDASFDHLIMKEKCAVIAPCKQLKILIGRSDFQKQQLVLNNIRAGFTKVGLICNNVEIIRIDGPDTAHSFSTMIKKLPDDTSIVLVVIPNQNKEKYDAIKKAASVEYGFLTQVVTSKLMCDERKGKSAGVKIGVQVCAKLGGEPWWINIPLKGSMVCGYDTYHDSLQRGRSFGAFVASMNSKFSRWWSKADEHDKIDELSAHITKNLLCAMDKYKEKNEDKFPDRIIIYRDGVGDGQLSHVVDIELKEIEKAVKAVHGNIRVSYIIVNKRVGARFYWKNGPNHLNCPPGTIIDNVVTRKCRYDFYLISQSTRNGTVSPTYYNIIQDETDLGPERHQKMAYKLCLGYYNWTGTVKVPAPCQYAHKLALLCGEHLHKVPNAILDDKLHFL